MKIPHTALEPSTLQALIEEFVTRDGTDYGASETPVSSRVIQVRNQLERGTAVIWFDSDSESWTVLATEQCPLE